jgi:hypothetical protein
MESDKGWDGVKSLGNKTRLGFFIGGLKGQKYFLNERQPDQLIACVQNV